MKAAYLLTSFVALALLTGLTSGCRKRKPATEAVPEPAPAAPATPAAPAQAPAPVSLPTGEGSKLAPNAKGEPAKEAAKTQDRFNRNTGWISKLSGNNPQLRAQALAEIQKAGLSPAEMQELRKQAQMYGVKL